MKRGQANGTTTICSDAQLPDEAPQVFAYQDQDLDHCSRAQKAQILDNGEVAIWIRGATVWGQTRHFATSRE